MNKPFLIRAVVLLLALSFLLVGCKGSTDADGQTSETDYAKQIITKEQRRSNIEETDAETGERYYLLGDFENYYECSQIKYSADFGLVEQINKSAFPSFITNGEQSIKVTIEGGESTWFKQKPSIRFATTTAFFNRTTDFSNLSRLTVDIFNAMDYPAQVSFYIDEKINSPTLTDRVLTDRNHSHSIVSVYELKPNDWTHLEISPEDMKVVQYDTAGKPFLVTGAQALKTVGAFVLMFDRGELHDEQEVFYIDNCRAYLTD